MDLHRLAHDIFHASRQTQVPFLIGLVGSIKLSFKSNRKDDLGDLGDTPRDSILPKEILISLSSRREIPGRF